MNKFLNPVNYWRKLIFIKDKLSYGLFYDVNKIKAIELEKFQTYSFDYEKALKKVNKILTELGKDDFHDQRGMASVHWLLFSGISQNHTISNILEIGTFDGETTLILAKIFPNSAITTVDLPESDPILASTYQRDNKEYLAAFLAKQQQNTSANNINLIKKNSFFLSEVVDKKFDLIWVDGGHLYPEISWDICNTYHLCQNNGWIMYDDIIPNKNYHPEGASPDAYHILEYLKQRITHKITYFLKRDHINFSASPKKRKFVALMHKRLSNADSQTL